MQGNEQLAVIIPKLRSLAAAIGGDQLENPTPCTEFSVAGVLDHMTGLASAFAPMFRGEPPPDPTEVGTDRGDTQAFDVAMKTLLDAVESPGALDRTVTTPAGPMPGAVFARLVALDGLIHGWDLAVSTDQEWDLPADLVAEVDDFARQAITTELRESGAFGIARTSPESATALERLVAFSGRTL